VPLCRADLRLALSEDEARRVELQSCQALQQQQRGSGFRDPRHEPLLQLCQALHAHLSELQQLLLSQGPVDGALPGERRRMSSVVG